jgi:hypothetical protein
MSENEFEIGSVTGRFVRDAMLRRGIERVGSSDLAAIQKTLPANFGTDAAEVALMVAHMSVKKVEGNPPAPVEGEPVTVAGDPSAPVEGEPVTIDPRDPVPGEGGYGADAADESPVMTVDEAYQVLSDWQAKMHAARTTLHSCTMEQKAARANLVEKINYFLNGNPQTREALIREHIASENARRAGVKAHRAATHGPSVVDIGRSGRGGSVNQRYGAVRRGLVPGQRAYSLHDSIARSGSGVVDTHGTAAVPAVKSE